MITLIKDAISTGTSDGTTITQSQDTGQESHSFQISFTGSPTALVFSILGTIDGTNYAELFEHTLSTDELTAGNAIVHLINCPAPKIKAQIKTLTGGTSPTVSIYYFKGTL